MTNTALAGIQREADHAGVTLESALKTCCERGWVGFKAEWTKSTASTSSAANTHKYAAAARAIFGNSSDELRTIDA